jgi:hypothetical protein
VIQRWLTPAATLLSHVLIEPHTHAEIRMLLERIEASTWRG